MFIVSLAATSSLITGCSGAETTSNSKDDTKAREAKEAKIEDTQMYLDGELVRLLGGADPNDWSVEMSAPKSVELVKKTQEEYRANPEKSTVIHVTVDGTSTEFYFHDPAIDIAGPWEKFATQSVKFKNLDGTVHHFAGTESSIDNDVTAERAKVPVADCVQNIQNMADVIGQLAPGLDDIYAAHIGVHSCGEQEAVVNFHVARPEAALAKDLAAAYGKIDGPAVFSNLHFDRNIGELTAEPAQGHPLDTAKLEELEEVLARY